MTTSYWESASFVVGKCLYMAGGQGRPSGASRFDTASNTWVEGARMLEGRRGLSAVTIKAAGPL
jgi:hypothetical protein